MNEAEQIARLNDEFRRSGRGIVVTPGIQEIEDLPGLIDEIRRFDLFTKSNDPHGEHDFGIVYWFGAKIFWKIDYYDAAMKYGTHPLDSTCRRVMTVMLANEY